MSKDKELQDALAKMLQKDAVTFYAMVVSVDKEKGTCLAADDGLEYKARLSAVINNESEKFFLFPKVGSKVLIACIEEDLHQLYVAKYSDIEDFQLKIADSILVMDASGFNFKKENESLRSLVLELIDGIKKMRFTTNFGPTINLINIADFEAVETKFKSLLKDI